LNNGIVNTARESGNLRVDSPRKAYKALDLDMPDDTIFEFRESNNVTVDVIKESNITTPKIAMDSYNTIALRDLDNVLDVPSKAMATDMLRTTEPDPTTSKYDIIDLDILRVKNRV
jgi:hypothetical protein